MAVRGLRILKGQGLFLVFLAFFPSRLPLNAQEPYESLVKRFDYDASEPLDLREGAVETRQRVHVSDVSYASPKGGRVPAYLVVPSGEGPFGAVVFAHWKMPGSPTRNRTEFLNEAVALAQAGAVCLLPDAPFARPGIVEESDPLSPQGAELLLQQIVDIRRGIDLLVSRKDVDPKRVAYVGHSYGAGAGGVLTGVEKRIKTFVLMAGNLAVAESLRSDDPEIAEWRREVGEARLEGYLKKYAYLDPIHYVAHASPASVLLQFARRDEFIKESLARRFLDLLRRPKEMKMYDATHVLNSQARLDRYEWLRARIGLKPLPPGVMRNVPETR